MKKISSLIKENQISIFDSGLDKKEVLFKKIEPLGSWIFKSDGLGMMRIIDEIFSEYNYTTPISQEQIKKFNLGIEILRKTDMNSYINSQLSYKLPGGISNAKLVLDDKGDWHHVNKLNTNYSDLSDLLSELIIRGINRNYEKGNTVYESIVKDPKNGLLSIKPHLKKLIIFYFIDNGGGIEDFKSFTKFSTKMSLIGEINENKVVDFLKKSGFTISYQGGNGDFIDMIFGTDVIIFREDFKYKTVQIKSRIRDWSKLSHYKVDWVAETDPIKIYNLKDKPLVDL